MRFWTGGIIGPYFFENEAGAAVSVNGLRYRTMINEFLWPELEDMDVDDVYFKQDGVTRHTSDETVGLLSEKFPGRVTPLDFFLWVYVKDKVYADAPQSIKNSKRRSVPLSTK